MEKTMTVWMKDAAAGLGLLVFMVCAFVLAGAAQAVMAAG
jgi:hypothetical protein